MARSSRTLTKKSARRPRRWRPAAGKKKTSGRTCAKGIPPRLRKYAEVLCILSKSSPKVTKRLILTADPALLKTISECSLNVLRGAIPLTPLQKKRLSRYKSTIRIISKRSTSSSQRRALLQKGGFVPILLKTILPLVLPSLVSFIGKKIAGRRR